jgi:hypothetical protein
MSILNIKDRKVQFGYKLPEWLLNNISKLAQQRGININELITETLLDKYPELNKKENKGLNRLMSLAKNN